MKRIIALLLCAAVMAGCLSGCSTETKQSHVPTGDGLYWGDVTEPPMGAGSITPEKSQIVMAYYEELGMNPYQCTDYTNRAVFPLMYQSLFITDREYNVLPQLCSSFSVSEDMRYYTFYVDPKARFSDGEPVQGEDVTASLLAAMSGGYYVGRFTHIRSISNTRDGGVLIQLDTPYEELPRLLDIPIVKKEQVGEAYPLGSGPYLLRSNGDSVALHQNANWWCDVAMPVDQQIISLSPVTGSNGQVDIRDQFEFYDVSLVLADPCSDFYAAYRCDYELWDCDNGIFVYLGCRTEESIFAKKEIRNALTYAIDREKLAEEIYRGFAQPTVLPASPNSPYYDAVMASRYQYDKAKFRQALVDNGELGAEIELLANSDDTLRIRAARAIAEMLTDCGLKVTLVEKTTEEYYHELQYREFDLYLGQTRLPPNMDLSEYFHTDGMLSFGPMNEASLLAASYLALENSGNYRDLYQLILDDGRLCPILFRSYAVYASRGMLSDLQPARDNLFPYSVGRTLEEARMELDPEAAEPEVTAPEDTTAPEGSGE